MWFFSFIEDAFVAFACADYAADTGNNASTYYGIQWWVSWHSSFSRLSLVLAGTHLAFTV